MSKRNLVIGAIAISALLALSLNSLALNLKPLYSFFETLIVLLTVILSSKRIIKSSYAKFIFIGLALYLLGHISLMFPPYFPYGSYSFVVANLSFIIAFSRLDSQNHKVPLIILALIGLISFLTSYEIGIVRILSEVNLFILLFMCWKGLNPYLTHKNKGNKQTAAAVCLLLFSYACVNGVLHSSFIEVAGAVSYWTAITLLAISTYSQP